MPPKRQVYLYLLWAKATNTGTNTGPRRNPLLLNKGADIMKEKKYPADWWRYADDRGCKLVNQGRWAFTSQPSKDP